MRRVLADWPEIKAPRMTEILREHGYAGSVDVVKRRLRELRPANERPAQRTGYRPGQVLQLDWAELPTRPRIEGRERRVYALVGALPYCGAQSAHFSFDMTPESFPRGPRAPLRLARGRPTRVRLRQPALGRRLPRARADHWNARFLHLRGHYAFHATACTPQTPREKGSVEGAVRHLKSGFWPARRIASLADLDEQYRDWRDSVCNRRRHASGRFAVAERLSEERAALRALPPARFDYAYARESRVPLDGYLRYRGSFYRAPEALVHERVTLRADRDCVWITRSGEELVRYLRSYEPGTWATTVKTLPAPSRTALSRAGSVWRRLSTRSAPSASRSSRRVTRRLPALLRH